MIDYRNRICPKSFYEATIKAVKEQIAVSHEKCWPMPDNKDGIKEIFTLNKIGKDGIGYLFDNLALLTIYNPTDVKKISYSFLGEANKLDSNQNKMLDYFGYQACVQMNIIAYVVDFFACDSTYNWDEDGASLVSFADIVVKHAENAVGNSYLEQLTLMGLKSIVMRLSRLDNGKEIAKQASNVLKRIIDTGTFANCNHENAKDDYLYFLDEKLLFFVLTNETLELVNEKRYRKNWLKFI